MNKHNPYGRIHHVKADCTFICLKLDNLNQAAFINELRIIKKIYIKFLKVLLLFFKILAYLQ